MNIEYTILIICFIIILLIFIFSLKISNLNKYNFIYNIVDNTMEKVNLKGYNLRQNLIINLCNIIDNKINKKETKYQLYTILKNYPDKTKYIIWNTFNNFNKNNIL